MERMAHRPRRIHPEPALMRMMTVPCAPVRALSITLRMWGRPRDWRRSCPSTWTPIEWQRSTCSSPTSGPSRPSGSETTSRAAERSAPTKRPSGSGQTPPGHGNQTLRYWLRPTGLNPVIAGTPHRALPDAYVTACLLREMLKPARMEELIAWTRGPTRCPGSPSGGTEEATGTRSRRTISRGSWIGRSWARRSSIRPGTTVVSGRNGRGYEESVLSPGLGFRRSRRCR